MQHDAHRADLAQLGDEIDRRSEAAYDEHRRRDEVLATFRRYAEQTGADAERTDRNSHDRAYAAGRRDAYTNAARKGAVTPELVAALAPKWRSRYADSGETIAAYATANLSGNIKRNRDRLARLERELAR